jgi:hypothetical protein
MSLVQKSILGLHGAQRRSADHLAPSSPSALDLRAEVSSNDDRYCSAVRKPSFFAWAFGVFNCYPCAPDASISSCYSNSLRVLLPRRQDPSPPISSGGPFEHTSPLLWRTQRPSIARPDSVYAKHRLRDGLRLRRLWLGCLPYFEAASNLFMLLLEHRFFGLSRCHGLLSLRYHRSATPQLGFVVYCRSFWTPPRITPTLLLLGHGVNCSGTPMVVGRGTLLGILHARPRRSWHVVHCRYNGHMYHARR